MSRPLTKGTDGAKLSTVALGIKVMTTGRSASYLALLRKTPDSDWGVEFPDVPGCISAGTTMAEALAAAREALQGHLETLDDLGEPIPQPRQTRESAFTRYEADELLHAEMIEVRPPARVAG